MILSHYEISYQLKNLELQKNEINKKIFEFEKQINRDIKNVVNPKVKELLKVFNGRNLIEILENGNAEDFEKFGKIFNHYNEAREFVKFDLDYFDLMLKYAEQKDGIMLPKSFGLNGINMLIGKLTYLAARPGIGKSTAMLNMLYDNVINGIYAIVFSFEMLIEELLYRLTGIYLYNEFGEIKNFGQIKKLVKENNDVIKKFIARVKNFIMLIDSSRWKASAIISKFNYSSDFFWRDRGKKFDICYIDYFQRIHPENRKAIKLEQLNETLNILTNFAKNTNVVWVILSQAHRANNYNDGLSVFKGTGDIEEDMGLGIILNREKEKDIGEYKQEIEIEVVKNRLGPLGKSKVYFNNITGSIGGNI